MAAGLAIADLALPEAILKVVNDREKLDTWEYSLETNTEHQTIVGAIKSLESLGDVSVCVISTVPQRVYDCAVVWMQKSRVEMP